MMMKMAKTERIYNVPLRRGFQRAVSYKRAKKAVKTLKEFMARHMKCDYENVKLGPIVNQEIWKRGIKSPPHHVKVTAIKEDDVVTVELFGHKYPQTETKKEDKKNKKDTKPKTEEKTKTKDAKVEEKEVKPTEIKKEVKTETPKPKKVSEKKDSKPKKTSTKPAAKKSSPSKTVKKVAKKKSSN